MAARAFFDGQFENVALIYAGSVRFASLIEITVTPADVVDSKNA